MVNLTSILREYRLPIAAGTLFTILGASCSISPIKTVQRGWTEHAAAEPRQEVTYHTEPADSIYVMRTDDIRGDGKTPKYAWDVVKTVLDMPDTTDAQNQAIAQSVREVQQHSAERDSTQGYLANDNCWVDSHGVTHQEPNVDGIPMDDTRPGKPDSTAGTRLYFKDLTTVDVADTTLVPQVVIRAHADTVVTIGDSTFTLPGVAIDSTTVDADKVDAAKADYEQNNPLPATTGGEQDTTSSSNKGWVGAVLSAIGFGASGRGGNRPRPTGPKGRTRNPGSEPVGNAQTHNNLEETVGGGGPSSMNPNILTSSLYQAMSHGKDGKTAYNNFTNQLEQVVNAFNGGKTVKQIARQQNLSVQNAYKMLSLAEETSGFNIERSRYESGHAKNAGLTDYIAKLYNANENGVPSFSIEDIRKKFKEETGMGISKSTIYKVLKEQNVQLRRGRRDIAAQDVVSLDQYVANRGIQREETTGADGAEGKVLEFKSGRYNSNPLPPATAAFGTNVIKPDSHEKPTLYLRR